MPDEPVRLALEWARASHQLQSAEPAHLPLPLAAAIAFHYAHGERAAVVTRREYDKALDIAAAALSRLIPIYTLRGNEARPLAIAVHLATQQFGRGAAELRDEDGTVYGELFVARADLFAALPLVERAGIEFGLPRP